MDINEAWKKINEEKFSSTTIKKEEIMNAISKESSLTISELKKRLKYKIYWVGFFILAFSVGIIWNIHNPGFVAIFSMFLVIYLFGGSGLYQEYKEMNDHVDASKDTLSEMRKHRYIMKRALNGEKRWGMISFPIIIIGMLLLPKVSDGIPLFEILTDTAFLIKLVVIVLVLTFSGQWLGKKMNDKAYGEYIRNLDNNIKKMEEL